MKTAISHIIPLFFMSLLIALSFSPYASGYKNSHVKTGTYVYTWYDTADPVSWEYPKITDKPVIGFYNSCDASVIAWQISQIRLAGFDFTVLNWLGEGSFSDLACEAWFNTAKENGTALKLALMIEPFNETTDGYNYTAIYERAYTLYESYEAQSLLIDNKPVICFYNGAYLTGDLVLSLPFDSRFTVLLIGHRDYVDVWYDDIRNYLPSKVPWGRALSVLPRFDDYWQFTLGLRDHTHTIDRDLTEGLYKRQWERARKYANKGALDSIWVATWNEYPERTAIEPHYDNTAKDTNPYYLLNQTAYQISLLHGIEPQIDGAKWYDNPWTYGIVMSIIILVAVIIWKS